MKKQSKRTKRIRNLVLVCVLSALLLTVSTYAWFIGMRTVAVNQFEITIDGVDSLMLSLDGEKWAESVTLTGDDADEAYDGNTNQLLNEKDSEGNVVAGLSPVSSVGVIDTTSSRMILYEKGSLTATDGGYRIMASRVDNYTTSEGEDEKIKVTQGDGYVVFDLFVMNLSGDAYYDEYDPENEEAIYLTHDSAVTAGNTGGDDYGLENSIRVAFAQIGRVKATTDDTATITGIACNDQEDNNYVDETTGVTSICTRTATIWEPNELAHEEAALTWYEKTCSTRTAEGYGDEPCAELSEYHPTFAIAKEIVASDKVDVYDGDYNGYEENSTEENQLLLAYDTFTDTEKETENENRATFMTLAPNSITKVRVYVYLEGQDVDNYDFASLGNSVKVNFGFTKERFDEDYITGEPNDME